MGLALCLLPGSTVFALDKSRLWLPGKYKDLMPKLVDAAIQAERTQRCEWVINGKMNVKKSTPEHHYFVITCRDERRHSYILTYHYPIDGDKASLQSEQGSQKTLGKKNKDANEPMDIEQPKLDSQAALEICNEAFYVETDSMDGVVIVETDISVVKQDNDSFFYQYPFNIDSVLGNNIRHRADCRVSAVGEVDVQIFLEPEGALALCKDTLREETLLMRRVKVTEEPLKKSRTEAGGFAFTIAFSAKSRRGSPIHYTAECRAGASGENELRVVLEKSGALAICKDTLRSEAIQLKGLEVIEAQIPEVVENDDGFLYSLPFNATMPGGEKGLYKATCQVDVDGTSDVSFAIDRQAVVPLCIEKLKASTRNMINVAILEKSNIPVIENKEEYTSAIAFNAQSPMGKTLRYQGNCRVNGIGVTSVSVVPRRE
jgi:hypothetical protein